MKNNLILIVDDNEKDLLLTLRSLESSEIPFELAVARDGAEALEFLSGSDKYKGRDTSHLPQLVLLDLKMPKLDGFQVLRQIRSSERTKYLPVVIFTSSSEVSDVKNTYSLGASSYIRKPIDFAKYSETVRSVGVYWLLLNENPPVIQE